MIFQAFNGDNYHKGNLRCFVIPFTNTSGLCTNLHEKWLINVDWLIREYSTRIRYMYNMCIIYKEVYFLLWNCLYFCCTIYTYKYLSPYLFLKLFVGNTSSNSSHQDHQDHILCFIHQLKSNNFILNSS